MCFSVLLLFKHKTAYELRISDWSSYLCSSDLYWFLNMDLIVDDARILGIPVVFAGQSFRSGKRDMDEDMAEIGVEASKVFMRRDGIADNGARESASAVPASHQPLNLGSGVTKIGRASCRERVCQ